MSKIIQPFGKIVRSIKIEMDIKGVSRITAEAIHPLTNQHGPVPAIELCAILSHAAAAQVSAVLKAIQSGVKETSNDGQETEKEDKPHKN